MSAAALSAGDSPSGPVSSAAKLQRNAEERLRRAVPAITRASLLHTLSPVVTLGAYNSFKIDSITCRSTRVSQRSPV